MSRRFTLAGLLLWVAFVALGETHVTDDGLLSLQALTDLQEVWFGNAQVSPEAVAEFQMAVPRCHVHYDEM